MSSKRVKRKDPTNKKLQSPLAKLESMGRISQNPDGVWIVNNGDANVLVEHLLKKLYFFD